MALQEVPEMPKLYANIRVEALYSWQAVVAMQRHGNREGGDLRHVDPARTPLNKFGSEFGDPHRLSLCMRSAAYRHLARQRKGGPVGTHILLTASPGYFRPDAPEAAGTWQSDRLDPWIDANLAWLHQRFPGQLAAWRVDLDESTPHMDAFIVPVHVRVTKTGRRVPEISHRAVVAQGMGAKGYERLQDEYAAAVAGLGLERGRAARLTGAKHKPPVVLRREMVEDAAALEAMRIGMKLWTLGRMKRMRWNQGQPAADFVGIGPERHRAILDCCRPAWALLVPFSDRLERQVGAFFEETCKELVSTTEEDRRQAEWLHGEAEFILGDLRSRGIDIPVDLSSRLEEFTRQLVR
jgi:hypothetical protein